MSERPTQAEIVRASVFLRDGEPCGHAGCLHHVTHPCEGCGRIAGRHVEANASRAQDVLIKFDDFLNEPFRRDEGVETREYRHAAYREWRCVQSHIAQQSEEISSLKAQLAEAQKVPDGCHAIPDETLFGIVGSIGHGRAKHVAKLQELLGVEAAPTYKKDTE